MSDSGISSELLKLDGNSEQVYPIVYGEKIQSIQWKDSLFYNITMYNLLNPSSSGMMILLVVKLTGILSMEEALPMIKVN